AVEDLWIVQRGDEFSFRPDPAPCRIGLHHAPHHSQVAALLDISVFEEAGGDQPSSFGGFDTDGNWRNGGGRPPKIRENRAGSPLRQAAATASPRPRTSPRAFPSHSSSNFRSGGPEQCPQ